MSPAVRAVSMALTAALLFGCSYSHQVQASSLAGPVQAAGIAVEAAERGRMLTSTACAGCHATDVTGGSPTAEAPPFREIVHRYPLDQLEEAFSEGLVTAHPAMPKYTFRASEIDDIIAWLETLKPQE